MSYGEPDRGNHPWTLGEAASRPFIKQALDLGINFFDTANVYSDGTSEEIVGRALLEYARRDEVVIATKVHGRMHTGPNGAGLSRKAILAEIDASLKRLGTDYVDLYQIHRWDSATPIEETLEALNDVVKAGKALHIGASSMYAWQFAKALHSPSSTAGRASSRCRTTTTCSTARKSARCCRSARPRASASSRGARWRAAGSRATGTRASARTETDEFGTHALREDAPTPIARWSRRSAAVAARLGLPRAQVALAWVLAKSEVTAPIVGATKLEQLDDAVAALSLDARARRDRRARGAVRAARGRRPRVAGAAPRWRRASPYDAAVTLRNGDERLLSDRPARRPDRPRRHGRRHGRLAAPRRLPTCTSATCATASPRPSPRRAASPAPRRPSSRALRRRRLGRRQRGADRGGAVRRATARPRR